MFDQSTYSPELIKASKDYDRLQGEYIRQGALGNEMEQKKLVPKMNKAYEKYAKYHNDWCDKHGYERLKI